MEAHQTPPESGRVPILAMTDALPSSTGPNDGIVLLVTNEFLDDPRVYRAASALAEHGHRTSVVCFVDNSARPAGEEHRGVQVLRIARSSRLFGRLRDRSGRPGAIAPSAPSSGPSLEAGSSPPVKRGRRHGSPSANR